MPAAFQGCIGIDWGTTHRRVTVLAADGSVRLRHDDDQGALTCQGRFADSVHALLATFPADCAELPLVMAGMVGSSLGWQEAPYLSASEPLTRLAVSLTPVKETPSGARWLIVPGLRCETVTGVDVMRGEETQLLGALLQCGAAADGTWVLPGTHSKWVTLREGRVTSLRTYMTGELFALLRAHGTLANALKDAAPADTASPAFAAGVAAAADPALSHQLFGVRARILTGHLAAHDGLSWLSGLLIGTEWQDAMCRGAVSGPVRLIAAESLTGHHSACAERLGATVERVDPQPLAELAWRFLAG